MMIWLKIAYVVLATAFFAFSGYFLAKKDCTNAIICFVFAASDVLTLIAEW